MSEKWLDPRATSVSAAWLGHEGEHGEQAYGTDEEEVRLSVAVSPSEVIC